MVFREYYGKTWIKGRSSQVDSVGKIGQNWWGTIEMSVQNPRESENRKLSAIMLDINRCNESLRGEFLCRSDYIGFVFGAVDIAIGAVDIAIVAGRNSRIVGCDYITDLK